MDNRMNWLEKKKHNDVFFIVHVVKEQRLKFLDWESKLEALLWCNEIALESERIIGMQDVIHCNNFFERWNKRHANFEQSSTDNLSSGNGIVRRPGDKVITFVPDLDSASSRKTWVNGLHDYKDGRLREWRKCFLIALCSLARKKFFYGKNSRYWENNCKIGKAGGCCSNPDPPDQIGRVGIFQKTYYI